MKYIFHPEARKEFLQEIHHYRQISDARGKDFNRAVWQKIDLILNHPKAHGKVGGSTTRKTVILKYQFNIFLPILSRPAGSEGFRNYKNEPEAGTVEKPSVKIKEN